MRVWLVVLSLVTCQALRADESYSVRGAGLLDCKAYSEQHAQKSTAYLMIGGWIDGYLTGVNQYRDDTYDITSFEGTELIASIVKRHCDANPTHRLSAVVRSIVESLAPNRIVEPSHVEVIEDGERKAFLYRATIIKLQLSLRLLKLFQNDPNGVYDSATKDALMAYQKSIGFKPTGFPDQATLWRLFTPSK